MDNYTEEGQALVTGSPGDIAFPFASGLIPDGGFTDECVHFWVIETPNGPTSEGLCKLCGKAQQFRNSISGSMWNKGIARREDGWSRL